MAAQEELGTLSGHLASALGLGGRDRRFGAAAERARLTVTKAIRDSLRRIADRHPALGAHLAASIRTGTYCSYDPPPGDAGCGTSRLDRRTRVRYRRGRFPGRLIDGAWGAVVLVATLTAAVDEMCGADPSVLADGETLVALQREIDRLQAVAARAAARFDASHDWEADGARSAAAWLATRCRLPLPTVRRRVWLGRALRSMPVVEGAWLAGEVSDAHVASLASARTSATTEAFERDEAGLVGYAARLRYKDFCRKVAYWLQSVDPDGVEDEAARDRDERRVHLSESFRGRWYLDGLLDPIGGTIVTEALRRIEEELFEADWAEARARVGDGVCTADLARTPAQRRADALVEMARRAQAVPADARLPAPLFTVLVGYETFAGRICQLANGSVVTPGSLVPWLDDAWVERVVFDGPSRVLDVGHRRRLFTGATRRAVEVRDQECYEDFCDTAADRCEIDHVQPWAAGGPTTTDNGRPACGYHNRRRNRPRQRPP